MITWCLTLMMMKMALWMTMIWMKGLSTDSYRQIRVWNWRKKSRSSGLTLWLIWLTCKFTQLDNEGWICQNCGSLISHSVRTTTCLVLTWYWVIGQSECNSTRLVSKDKVNTDFCATRRHNNYKLLLQQYLLQNRSNMTFELQSGVQLITWITKTQARNAKAMLAPDNARCNQTMVKNISKYIQ